MPGFDGTGPLGQGPMGFGRGPCQNQNQLFQHPKYMQCYRGMGRGRGFGFGRNFKNMNFQNFQKGM